MNPELIEKYKHFAFDMDGTLYDEFQYVKGAYRDIAEHEKFDFTDKQREQVLSFLSNRWLEKGSSYPFIFSECFEQFGGQETQDDFIKSCLSLYRNHKPILRLPARVEYFLEQLSKAGKSVFLISDGYGSMQQSKFDALDLGKYFSSDRVFFTYNYGKECYKPSTKIMDHITFVEASEKVLYFGDRDLDEEFASTLNWDFVRIKQSGET